MSGMELTAATIRLQNLKKLRNYLIVSSGRILFISKIRDLM